MSNSAFYKVHAFGTPNAMTPSTVQNGSNKRNGYVQNFGGNIYYTPPIAPLDNYLVVNGIPSTTVPIFLLMEGQFVVPVKGVITKIVVSVETATSAQTEFISVYNSSDPTSPFDCTPLVVGANQFSLVYPVAVGDILTVTSNYKSDKTFVTLYIE